MQGAAVKRGLNGGEVLEIKLRVGEGKGADAAGGAGR